MCKIDIKFSSDFTHELTDMCVISICSPTAFDVSPDDFKRTARQTERMALAFPKALLQLQTLGGC